jgi:excisionase family DNA binding protein
MTRLLNVAEVANLLGIKVSTIRAWVLERKIPYYKIGRSIRFSEQELQEFLQKNHRIPSPLQ